MKKLFLFTIILPFLFGCNADIDQNALPQGETIPIAEQTTNTYEESEYRFDYPDGMKLEKPNLDNTTKVFVYSQDYRETGNMYELKSGYYIFIQYENLPEGQSWLDWAKRPGGSIGETTEEGETNHHGQTAYRRTTEGNAFLDEGALIHVTKTLFLPHPEKNKMATIGVTGLKKDRTIFEPVFNNLIESFSWR